jgi:hypothetical protein
MDHESWKSLSLMPIMNNGTLAHTSVARSKLGHSSALGKKSLYSCQKLSLQSNANKRRHANRRSQSVWHREIPNVSTRKEHTERTER